MGIVTLVDHIALDPMSKIEAYKAGAERCAQKANASDSDWDRYCWTRVAAAWQALAEAEERQGRSFSIAGFAARAASLF